MWWWINSIRRGGVVAGPATVSYHWVLGHDGGRISHNVLPLFGVLRDIIVTGSISM